MKVTSNTALIAGGIFVLLLIVGFAKLSLYMVVAAAGVGLISHSLSNSVMGALGAAAITLLILGVVNHYYKSEGFNTNTPPSDISTLLRKMKKSGFEGFRTRDDEDDEEGFRSRDDDDEEEGFRSRNDDDDEEEGFRSRNDDDDEEEGFRSRNDDDDEEEGFRGFEGFKTATGKNATQKKLVPKKATEKKLVPKKATQKKVDSKKSWSNDAKEIKKKNNKSLDDINTAIKYLQESRKLTKESGNIFSKHTKAAHKKGNEGFAGNVFQNISKLGYNVPGFGISGPHVEGYEDVKREKDAIPAPASKNDTLPMPFKLGEIPSQIKNGPHIDAGSTLMKAIQNLNPDQINAMSKDTQQLIETQKSLMSMLGTMKPMLNDGKELMNTFQQMFGQ